MKSLNHDGLMKACILVGFAIWIGYLILSGNIDLYLSPSLTWLAKLSVILLITLTIAALIPSKHTSNHCCCGHHHSHSTLTLMKILTFCIPLLIGFTVKPQVLSSTALVNSINTAGPLPFYFTPFSQSHKLSAAPKEPDRQSTESLKPAVLNSAETDLLQLALNDNPNQIYNRSYRLTGFVYKDPRLAKNQFVITRYVLTCCIIDAQPIGIIAESPSAPDLQANTWLEAEGVLEKRNINNSDKINPVHNFQAEADTVPYFIVSKFKKIPAPKDPYLTAPQ